MTTTLALCARGMIRRSVCKPVASGNPKSSRITWVPEPHSRDMFEGKSATLVMFQHSSHQASVKRTIFDQQNMNLFFHDVHIIGAA
jgi:hypothetical protein